MQGRNRVDQRRDERFSADVAKRGNGLQHALNAQKLSHARASLAERIRVTQHPVALFHTDAQFLIADLIDESERQVGQLFGGIRGRVGQAECGPLALRRPVEQRGRMAGVAERQRLLGAKKELTTAVAKRPSALTAVNCRFMAVMKRC